MSQADRSAAKGWQVGGAGYPVLEVDYNESDDEGLMMVRAWVTERELEWLCDIAEVAEYVLRARKLDKQSKARLKAAVNG